MAGPIRRDDGKREGGIRDAAGDGTGPTGASPGIGRGKGVCTGNLGIFGCFQGRGGGGYGRCNRSSNAGQTGRQRSSGSGFGRGPLGPFISDSGSVKGIQPEILKAQARHLEEALDGIRRRLRKMESGTKGDQQV